MTGGEYERRAYAPADREAVLGLYRETDGDRPAGWFDWRYVDNPFLDEVPAVVAERDGEVVAVAPGVPVPLGVGDERPLALLRADPVVAPAHQGEGLVAWTATGLRERYVRREPTVELAVAGRRDVAPAGDRPDDAVGHDGVTVRVPEYARVQAPGAVAGAVTDGGTVQAIGRVATPAVRGYLSVRDRLSAGDDDVAVERIEGAPPARLAALAAERRPGVAHAHRCAEFYRWRFGRPGVEYTTYLAHGDWGPAAALVLGRRTAGDATVASVVDVVPLDDGDEWETAVSRLLGTAVEDAREAAVVRAAGAVIPRSVFETWGFRAEDAFPFSLVGVPTDLLARPLVERVVDDWLVDGRRLARPENWTLSGCLLGLR